MGEDAADLPGKKRSPLLIGCLVVAGIVIGIPAACAAVLALTGDGEKHHDVDTGTADVNGFEWPLTVDQGRIYCPGAGRLVFESDGTRYALNGLAKGTHEYADIDPIWKDNPEIDGTRVDIGGLIEHGNTLCGYRRGIVRNNSLDVFGHRSPGTGPHGQAALGVPLTIAGGDPRSRTCATAA